MGGCPLPAAQEPFALPESKWEVGPQLGWEGWVGAGSWGGGVGGGMALHGDWLVPASFQKGSSRGLQPGGSHACAT